MKDDLVKFSLPGSTQTLSTQTLRNWRRTALVGFCVLFLSGFARAGTGAKERKKAVVGVSMEQTLIDGERMYRIGILPSGKPMMVAMPGGVSLPGTTFACASCHTRSGLGTEEGGLRTLPINGPNLFQPPIAPFQACRLLNGRKSCLCGFSPPRFVPHMRTVP